MPGMLMGLDLGTSNIVIYTAERGVLLDEPSVIAFDANGGIAACGQKAQAMLGRAPDSIRVVRPIRKGVISDFDSARRMIRHYIRKVCAYKVMKPRAAASIPGCVTEMERRSVEESVLAAGIRRVMLVDNTVAAAVGTGLELAAARGRLVVDIGGGTVDVSVITMHDIAASRSVHLGGDDLDAAIIRHLHHYYSVAVGERTAERIKREAGGALPRPGDPVAHIPGRHIVSGLPVTIDVRSSELAAAMEEPLRDIFQTVQSSLESVPPELAGDIMAGGLLLTGGGALLYGMRERVEHVLGIPCHVPEQPRHCVATGAVKLFRAAQKKQYAGAKTANQFRETIWEDG